MITIVSLAWNGYQMTEQFLTRLKKYTDIPHKLVFTDNGSTELIPDLVNKIYPDAQLIVEEENIGCPATRNEAMSFVDTELCFWLDNDTMVGPNWYQPILDKLADPSIGISGPDGWVARKPWDPTYPFEPKNEGDVDYFVGYLVGFKTDLYKLINDYHLPVNLDDVELALGIKENGGRAVVSEPCFAKHLVSQTKRGWQPTEGKTNEFWAKWPDKSLFENYK